MISTFQNFVFGSTLHAHLIHLNNFLALFDQLSLCLACFETLFPVIKFYIIGFVIVESQNGLGWV